MTRGDEQIIVPREEYITLGQLLKATGAASGGGEVKAILEAGGIRVNGEPESRRGRKLRPGDVVEFPTGRVRISEGPVADAGGQAGGIED